MNREKLFEALKRFSSVDIGHGALSGRVVSAITVVTALTVGLAGFLAGSELGSSIQWFSIAAAVISIALVMRVYFVYFTSYIVRKKLGAEPLQKGLLKPSAVDNAMERKEETRARAEFVSFNYLYATLPSAIGSAVGALGFAVLFFWMSETIAALVSGLIAILIVTHFLVTKYRVENGLFGSNYQEALDLIQFIVKHANDSGAPPGSKVAPVPSSQKQDEVNLFGQPVGGVR